jgi:hypothetical protein
MKSTPKYSLGEIVKYLPSEFEHAWYPEDRIFTVICIHKKKGQYFYRLSNGNGAGYLHKIPETKLEKVN